MTLAPAASLGEIADLVMGQAPPGAECNRDGRGEVFVKAGEFHERRPLVREWTTRPMRKARKGDVLVCVVGATAGKVNEGIECAIGRSVAAVRPVATRILSTYLYHFLSTQVSRLRARSQGLAQGVITREMLQEVQVPLPSLHEQRRIADVLDRAETLRAKRREALAQLDALSGSTFSACFGDPDPRRSGWSQAALTDVCDRITDGTHRSPPIQTSGVPYVTAKHLKETGLVFHADPWFISEADHREIYRRCDPKPGDVLYIKDGATTGIAAVNEYSFEFSMLSSLALLRPTGGRLHAQYLCRWLNMPTVKRNLLGAMAGVAIRRLTLAKISKICIPIPPWSLQLEFACRVATIENLRTLHRSSLAKLDELFASLQRRAFRGEL